MEKSGIKVLIVLILSAMVIALPYVVKAVRAAPAEAKKGGAPSVPVKICDVVKKDMPVEVSAFGTAEANVSVQVKPQVSGVLIDIPVKEGQNVKAGDALFTIDPKPYETALAQARAVFSRDLALYLNATNEARRQQELWTKGIASEDARDQARTAAQALAAGLQADDAAVSNASIQLQYCFVVSPTDGRTGERLVHPGNVVKANDTVMTVNQISPIRVNFSLPQQELPGLMRHMSEGKITATALIPGGEDKPETGELVFLDNAVNKATGTIAMKALFENREQRIWPGQFLKVTLRLDTDKNATVVPDRAVQTGQKGSYVFVVKPASNGVQTVESRPVVTGRSFGPDVSVLSGLEVGEQVVTEGHLRLAPGTRIDISSGAPQGAGKGGEKAGEKQK